ncbi:MAG: hypothetical protein M3N52_06640, partial [Actinomycetota bacterium]|nr:hypothetical protein [Actinomycetota bacterium]
MGVGRRVVWLLAVSILAVSVLAAGSQSAVAISCPEEPGPVPYEALSEAAAGLVGTVAATGSQPGVDPSSWLSLDVEASVGVDLGARVDVASFDLSPEVGQRVGLLLERGEDGWVTNSCMQYPPEALLAAAALPVPTGSGPIAFVVGGGYGPA